MPKSVETSHEGTVTILWNQQGRTDRTIPNNKLDIIIRDKGKGTCLLIPTAISGDGNAMRKETEKILKYEELIIEIQLMWSVKTKVIPVIAGATGTILKSFRQHLSNVPANDEMKELQKIAIFCIAQILYFESASIKTKKTAQQKAEGTRGDH